MSPPIDVEMPHLNAAGGEWVVTNLWQAGGEALHERGFADVRGAHQSHLSISCITIMFVNLHR